VTISGPCSSRTVDETGEPFVSGKEKNEILSPALRPGADVSGMFVEPLAADIGVSPRVISIILGRGGRGT
jgi:hypothetical protein